MEKYSATYKARLGLFVMVMSALLVIGIFYIGRQKHLFNPVFRLYTTFQNIGGVQIGNNVRFSGINVGTVDNIQIINDTTVRVDVMIDKDVQQFIKEDCKMTIASEGVIGDKIISITQSITNSSPVAEGQYLASVEPFDVDEIIASLKVTGENVEVVSYELAEMFYSINNGNGTLSKLIHDSTIADNINQTIVNLKRSTKGLNENMEAAKHNVLLRGYYKNKDKKEKADQKAADKKDPNKEGSDKDEPKKRRSWLLKRTRNN